MGIRRIVDEICTSCGKCVDVCPMDVLRMEGSRVLIQYVRDCQGCNLCVKECPQEGAIVISYHRERRIPTPW